MNNVGANINCYGLSVKWPLLSHALKHLVLGGGNVSRGCGTFRRQGLDGRSKPLESESHGLYSTLLFSCIYPPTHLPACLYVYLAAVRLPSHTLLPPWTLGMMGHALKSQAYKSPFSHNLLLARYVTTAIRARTTIKGLAHMLKGGRKIQMVWATVSRRWYSCRIGGQLRGWVRSRAVQNRRNSKGDMAVVGIWKPDLMSSFLYKGN